MSIVTYDPTGVGANAGAMRMYYNPTTRGLCCADRCLTEVLTGGTASATAVLTVLSGSGPYTLPATGVSGLRKTLANGSMALTPFLGDATGGLTLDTSYTRLESTGTLLYASNGQSVYKFDTVSNRFVPNWRIDITGGGTSVRAICCMGNRLWVGGNFLGVSYSGVSNAYRSIAYFDNASGAWFAPATGPAWIATMAASGSMLYIGGQFTGVGSLAASNIVALNTTNNIYSNPFGGGVNGTILTALAFSGPILHMGGDFSIASGAASQYLASFNTFTNTWTRYGTTFNNSVKSLQVVGPSLFVGGSFSTVNGISSVNFVNFTPPSTVTTAYGTTFSDMDCYASAVAPIGTPGSVVIVGGKFPGGRGLARLEGVIRTNIGQGATGPVALATVGSNVYAFLSSGINNTSLGVPQVARVWPYTDPTVPAYVTGRLSTYGTGAYTGTMALPANTATDVVYTNGAWALADDTIAIT